MPGRVAPTPSIVSIEMVFVLFIKLTALFRRPSRGDRHALVVRRIPISGAHAPMTALIE